MEYLKKLFVPDGRYRKFMWILSALCSLYVLPIILSGTYYEDDQSRILYGSTGWTADGRPLMELVNKFIHFGRPITDISPFTLLAGIIVFAYVSSLLMSRRLKEEKTGIISIFCFYLIMANPFMLPDIALKFDSFAMLLSLSLCIFGFCFRESDFEEMIPGFGKLPYVVFNLIITLMIFCTFQPVIGAFFAAVFVESLFTLKKKEFSLADEIERLCGLIAGTLIYLMIIAPLTVDKEGWRAGASKLSFSTGGVLKNATEKFGIYFSIIRRYISGVPKTVILAFIILFALGVICTVVSYKAGSNPEKIIIAAMEVLVIPFCVILLILPMSFLNGNKINDHMLISMGIIGFVLGIMLFEVPERLRIIVRLCCIVVMFFTLTYSATFGNALKAQREYEGHIMGDIVHDMNELNYDNSYKSFTIAGEVDMSPVLENAGKKYPQMDEIVPRYIYDDSWLGAAGILRLYGTDISYVDCTDEDLKNLKKVRPVVKNKKYDIYCIGERMIISFIKE
ncbi:MAG: glucosyltransferase domain-containing protein [Lachnospiraceae bacterium]|nr:glucosyltransferase domain-containing protein [Lachnospiraceae bacterium]